LSPEFSENRLCDECYDGYGAQRQQFAVPPMPENKSQRGKTYRGDHQNGDAYSPLLTVRLGGEKARAQPAFEGSSHREKTQCRHHERDKRYDIAARQESDRATRN
jgi:hypothetical protein